MASESIQHRSEEVDANSDESKSERVYRNLRRRIRELTLAPGTHLRKNDIALEYGVSRAPVSEAIARLAEEGLVEVSPRSGSYVTPIRAQDVRESLFIRTSLEIEAVRRVTEKASPALIEELEENLKAQEQALDDNDLALFYDLDEAFHKAIFAALDSPRALKVLEAARAPLDRPRRIVLPDTGRPRATFAEHRSIVDGIRAGDVDFAVAAMRLHFNRLANTIEAKLEKIEADSDKKK